jgi:hypothetical protein
MTYLADSIKVNLFHPGVKRMRFIIPWGVINERLENKEVTLFVTPTSQVSEAPFFFQAIPRPVLTIHIVLTHQTTYSLAPSSNDAGSRGGAGAPQPAPSQPATCFSSQPGQYVQGGDVSVNKNLREGLTALPLLMPGLRESGSHSTTPCRQREASHD